MDLSANTCDSHTLRQKDKDTTDSKEQKYLLTSNQELTHLGITLNISLLDPRLPVCLRRDNKTFLLERRRDKTRTEEKIREGSRGEETRTQ